MAEEKTMKKILALFLLLLFFSDLSYSQTATSHSVYGNLSKKDVFQAEQWLKLALGFWQVDDYPMAHHYCQMLVAAYPETHYATQANKLLNKMSNPKANKRRKFWHSNPGLSFGTP